MGQPLPPGSDRGPGAGPAYVPVTPLLPDDPPKVGEFWLDARLGATPAGIAFTAHDAANTPAMVILLSEGAAADAAARAPASRARSTRCTSTRCSHGAAMGKTLVGSPANTAAGTTILLRPTTVWSPRGRRWPTTVRRLQRRRPCGSSTRCRLRRSRRRGVPSGPDYQQYWINRVRPDWRGCGRCLGPAASTAQVGGTILVSWLLMLLLAALAVLIAILIFRNQPPQSPRRPTGSSAVRIAPVRVTIRVPAVAGDRGIAVLWFARDHRALNRAAASRQNPRLDRQRIATVHARGCSV